MPPLRIKPLATAIDEQAARIEASARAKQIAKLRDDFEAFRKHCFICEDGPLVVQEFMRAWTRHLVKFLPTHHCGVLSPPGTGKTTWIVHYVLWRLGNNPNLRVLLVSSNENTAKERLGEIRQHIEHNDRLREVFPHLRPAKDTMAKKLRWDATALFVERDPTRGGRTLILRDPSVAAVSMGSKRTGKRCDLLIMDDPTDKDEMWSYPARMKNIRDYRKVWRMRLSKRGRAILTAMHRWHDEDLIAMLMNDKRWRFVVQGVSDDCKLLEQPPRHIALGKPLASLLDTEDMGFDLPHLLPDTEELIEYKQMEPVDFGHQMQQRSMSSFDKTFNYQALTDYVFDWNLFLDAADDPRGQIGLRQRVLLQHWPVYVTTDFSGKGRTGCVIMAGARQPGNIDVASVAGEKDKQQQVNGRKYVVHVEVGDWGPGEEMCRRTIAIAQMWNAAAIIVENESLQGYLAEFWRKEAIGRRTRIDTIGEGHYKHERDIGIPALDSEFRRGEWAIPLGHVRRKYPGVELGNWHLHPNDPWCRLLIELSNHPSCTNDCVQAFWKLKRVFELASLPNEPPRDHLGLPVRLDGYDDDAPVPQRMFVPRATRMFQPAPPGERHAQAGAVHAGIAEFFRELGIG